VNPQAAAAAAAAAAAGGAPAGHLLAGARPLFAYRRYTEQEALSLPPDEVAAAIALTLGPVAAGGFVPAADAAAAAAEAAAAIETRPGAAAAQAQARLFCIS
jgi:hypothetical protein